MDQPQETALERAHRLVLEAQARVAHQAGIVAELAREGRDIGPAQAILATFRTTLRFMREDQADLQRRAARAER
jgi:hypothetical protein